jgi:hypothetical protein
MKMGQCVLKCRHIKDAGELPIRKHTTYKTWQKFEIKNTCSMFANLARAEKCRRRAYTSGVICITSDSLSAVLCARWHQNLTGSISRYSVSCPGIKGLASLAPLPQQDLGLGGYGDALAWEGSSSPYFGVGPWVPSTVCASRLRTVMGGEDAVLPHWIMRQVRGFKELLCDTPILTHNKGDEGSEGL